METEITDTVSRVCEIKLTEEELAERSQRMSEKKLKQTELEGKAKEIAKNFKTEIDGLDLEVGSLAKIIKNKAENRSLDCIRFYHTPTQGRTCVVRPDTGERLDERDMTDGEKKDYELRRLKAKEQELPVMPEKLEEPPKKIEGKRKGKAA